MELLVFMIVGVVGVIIGFWLTSFINKRDNKPSGTFIMDLTDPMKDVCTVELDECLESIYSKNQIILNVKTYGDFS